MSNSQIVPGGYPIPSLALVATDNKTIFGSGSAEDPIRAGAGGGGDFLASFVTLGPAPAVGMPVTASPAAPEAGAATTVTPANATVDFDASLVIGVITEVINPDLVRVQTLGQVTLTTADWDAITEDAGGLTQGTPYYAKAAQGLLTTVRPVAAGTYASLVGVAISATTMVLMCPSVPIGPHA